MLEGNFAIVAVHQDFPEMIGARNGSPLVAGRSEDGLFVASDVPAFLDLTTRSAIWRQRVVVLDKEIKFFDLTSGEKKRFPVYRWSLEQAEKGNFKHFMIKEIMEQKETIENPYQDEERSSKWQRWLKQLMAYFCRLRHSGLCHENRGLFIFQDCQEARQCLVGSEFPYDKDFLTDKRWW